jgi:hypothetical protein
MMMSFFVHACNEPMCMLFSSTCSQIIDVFYIYYM